MQFCVNLVLIMIYVLVAVHFNPEWNSQLLITINHSSGLLFIFLYFHKFNGSFKYGSFFYLDFISSVLTIQGNVYVLERCRCRLYGMLGASSHVWCFYETVTHYLKIIYVVVERANLFYKVAWVYIPYHNNVLWKNVLL